MKFTPGFDCLDERVSLSSLVASPHIASHAAAPAAVFHQADAFNFNPFHGQTYGTNLPYGGNHTFLNTCGTINGNPVNITGALTFQGVSWTGILNIRGNQWYDSGLYSDIYVSTAGSGSYGVIDSNMTSLPAGGTWYLGLYGSSVFTLFL